MDISEYFGKNEKKKMARSKPADEKQKRTQGKSNIQTNWRSDWTQSCQDNSPATPAAIKMVEPDPTWRPRNRGRGNRGRGWSPKYDNQKGKVHNKSKEKHPLPTSSSGWKPSSQPDTSTDSGKILAHAKTAQGYLNKMTRVTFERLSEKFVIVAKEDDTLKGLLKVLIDKIFEQALLQPTFCDIYAELCFSVHQEMKTFRKVMLIKCQEEFEKDDIVPPDNLSDDELIGFEFKAKRRMLGNIKFIGELYKHNILVEPVMYECMNRLLKNQTPENPDDEKIEALCDLLINIGKDLDTGKSRCRIDKCFEEMEGLQEGNVSSRIKFKVEDLKDLRNNRWKSIL